MECFQNSNIAPSSLTNSWPPTSWWIVCENSFTSAPSFPYFVLPVAQGDRPPRSERDWISRPVAKVRHAHHAVTPLHRRDQRLQHRDFPVQHLALLLQCHHPRFKSLDVASDSGVIVLAAGEKQDQCEQYLCYFFHNITLELMSLYSNDCCILLFWKPYVPIWHTSTLLCRVWQCARNTAREQWDYSLLYHSGFRNSLYANDVTYSLGNLYWSASSTGLSDQPWRAYSLESKR